MSQEIKLELTPSAPDFSEESKAITPAAEESAYLQGVRLTPEELRQVDEFSAQIDLKNSGIVLQYGTSCQKKIADFSTTALNGVRTKDMGETGALLTGLVTELRDVRPNQPERKGIFGWLKSKGDDLSALRTRYNSVEENVNRVVGVLEDHRNQLTRDSVMMDQFYATNLDYFKEMTMYILAGKKRLELERSTTLPELRARAQESGLTEDAQAANDFYEMCERFDKKLYDLEISRTVSMQMLPQIRMIQSSDIMMAEKITSTINNTIPLWKNQMVLAMGMAHAQQAMEAQREVTDLTNELIKKNAEQLKSGTVAIAQENERGIIDLETVQHANEQLIATLDEVIRIQDEGREKRRNAENELGNIEAELRQKLLDVKTTSPAAE